MTNAVGMLKKVVLKLEILDPEGDTKLTDSQAELVFIYGAASEGLSPFEVALSGKEEGEQLTIKVSAAGGVKYFCHLFPLVLQALGVQTLPESMNLGVTVSTVATPVNREVVRFIAQSISHECDCGGGCGCGC
jgi:hypothetical protein